MKSKGQKGKQAPCGLRTLGGPKNGGMDARGVRGAFSRMCARARADQPISSSNLVRVARASVRREKGHDFSIFLRLPAGWLYQLSDSTGLCWLASKLDFIRDKTSSSHPFRLQDTSTQRGPRRLKQQAQTPETQPKPATRKEKWGGLTIGLSILWASPILGYLWLG